MGSTLRAALGQRWGGARCSRAALGQRWGGARCSRAVLGLGWGLAACSVEDGLLGSLHGPGGAGGEAGSTAASGGRKDPALAASCPASSPIVTLGGDDDTSGYSTCTGRIASALFLNALCTCEDAELGDYLMTRGFDSSAGEYDAERTDDSGAAVGVNGDYVAEAGKTDIGGSFSVAGEGDLVLVGSLDVRGDFRAAGDVRAAGSTTIARDAWLAGSYLGVGPFVVSGELHHEGNVVAVPLLAESDSDEVVEISAPCPCESSSQLDIGALVDQAGSENDNATLGLGEDALEAISGHVELELPCGRFFFRQVSGSGDVVLRITGATALFVDGSVDLEGGLSVSLGQSAELDVFVKEDLFVDLPISLASQDEPAAGRIYVGGAHDVLLVSPFVGNLYAPRARVVAAASVEVWGAVFAQSFAASENASFVFDRAIYEASRTCGEAQPPQGSCSRCGSCSGGTACVDGVCGPCRSDADCCSQAVCANGSCAPLIEVR